MKRIETDIWKPVPGEPHKVKYAGKRPAEDVFNDLYYRLEKTGFLPDEYFLMDKRFEHGADFPADADIYCYVDFGASEGIYLDIDLSVYDKDAQKPKMIHFATGKTLGESDLDLDRMNLVASACTKAFHSDGVHARYICLTPEESAAESMITHLNAGEK